MKIELQIHNATNMTYVNIGSYLSLKTKWTTLKQPGKKKKYSEHIIFVYYK